MADVAADFLRESPADFLENLPKACKTKDLEDFLKRSPKMFPHKFSLLVGSLLLSRSTGFKDKRQQGHLQLQSVW